MLALDGLYCLYYESFNRVGVYFKKVAIDKVNGKKKCVFEFQKRIFYMYKNN